MITFPFNLNLRNVALHSVPEEAVNLRFGLLAQLFGKRDRTVVATATFAEAMSALAAAIGLPPSVTSGYGSDYRLELEAGFGVGCSLAVRHERVDRESDFRALPNGDRFFVRAYRARVEVGWGGSGRDLTAAAACLALYAQAVQLGQVIQAALDGVEFFDADTFEDLAARLAKTPEQVAEEQAAAEAKRQEYAAAEAKRKAEAEKRAAKRAAGKR